MLLTTSRWMHAWTRFFFGWPHPQCAAKETAWLDGVRGLAAFLVVMNHFNLEWLSMVADAPYGSAITTDLNPDGIWYYKKGERVWEIWRLPIFRIFVSSGNAQVAIFFILSGFVLSWSPLATLRTGRMDKLAQSLGSSVVRRWFRLYLPCFIVSYLYCLKRVFLEYSGVLGVFSELWDFAKTMKGWSNPFETSQKLSLAANNPYDYVMWTIPFEFGGSIFVYVLLLSLGRIPDYRRRAMSMAFVSLYAFYHAYWCQWLFGTGAMLADYVRQHGGFAQLSQHNSRPRSRLWAFGLMLGLLIMGLTNKHDSWDAFGYQWLHALKWPPAYYPAAPGRQVWGIGAILFIVSCSHLNTARKFFELGILQYLGRISFMIYLDHILINELIALPLRTLLYDTFCAVEHDDVLHSTIYMASTFQSIAFYCINWMVSVPIAASMAHFLEIWVDRPCTAFGKSLDERLVQGPQGMEGHGHIEEAMLPTDSTGLSDVAGNARLEMSEADRRAQRLI